MKITINRIGVHKRYCMYIHIYIIGSYLYVYINLSLISATFISAKKRASLASIDLMLAPVVAFQSEKCEPPGPGPQYAPFASG